jgi:hypothetical protein
MGTNYYRVPTVEELEQRREKLKERISRMNLSDAGRVERGFPIDNDNWDTHNPWTEFIEGISVHLGKRSGGWQFAWNHQNWKYYSTKEELFNFIKSGRVVNEYGDEVTPDEFIEMALNWCTDGWTNERYLKEELVAKGKKPLYAEHYVDIIVEDLRFMNTTEFS